MAGDESAFEYGGRFEVVRELGRGGMGVVYEARDRERDERVALKALLRTDAAGIDRFRREFRTLRSLDHASLVKLYELFSSGGQWFFTMELLTGCDFLAHVRGADSSSPPSSTLPPSPAGLSTTLGGPKAPLRPSPFDLAQTTLPLGAARPGGPPARAPDPAPVDAPASAPGRPAPAGSPREPVDYERLRGALLQLANGLLYLHERDKLHRDIKPSNVMVTAEGRVILLDFGLVTDLSPGAIDRSSAVGPIGTPLYMAPEHATGQLLTMASDWYCVGLMMYKALTGLLPHEEFAANVFQLLLARQQRDPPPPRAIEPAVPEDLSDLCARLLRRDPAARPAGREVVERLGRTLAAAPPAPPPAPPAPVELPAFVGRGGELAALDESLRAARAGRAVVVTVLGQSGVGKSRLVQQFLEGVGGPGGAVVLTGRCWEGESVPYKATVGLVDNLRRHLRQLAHAPDGERAVERLLPREVWALARLFPSLQRVNAIARAPRRAGEGAEPRELRRRAFAAARELFARMADETAVVLHVDDLQWGDRDSAELLAELLRGPGAPPLCVLLTCRSEDRDRSSFFRAFLPAAGAEGEPLRRELEVGPLPPADAEELARRLLGAGAGGSARALASESGGSPIFLQQLARDAGARPGAARGAGGAGGELTLERVLLDRLARLPDEARRLAELVAVARHPVTERVAGYAAEVSGRGGRASFDLLHAERIIRTCAEERGHIEAYHDRIREIIVAHVAEADRVAYHERLALALESSKHADSEVIAAHFRAARRFEAAGEHALAAAAQAEGVLAFDRAVRLYRFALECRPEPARARELRGRLGRALANAGRSQEAAEAYLSAIEGAPADEGRAWRMRAAEQYLAGGRMDEGYEVLGTLLETLGLRMPRTRRGALLQLVALRARLRLRGTDFRRRAEADVPPEQLARVDACWAIAMAIGNLDTTRGAFFQALNLLQALDAGEPYRVGRALSAEAAYGFILGARGRREAAELLARARKTAEEFDRPYLLGVTFLHEGMIAFLGEGEWAKTWELCQRGEAILRGHGTDVSYELTVAELYSNHSLLVRGELAALAARLGPALERAEDRRDLFAECYVRLRFRPLVNLAADRPDKVHADVAALRDRLQTREYYLQHYWRVHAEAQALAYGPRPGAAAEAAARLDAEWAKIEPFLRTRFHRIDALDLRARVALVAAARGELDPRAAQRRVAADAAAIGRAETLRGVPVAQCLRAGLAALRGARDEAADLLLAASEGFERLDMRLHAEAARRRRGELRGERGRAAVDAADAWMAGQGVTHPRRLTSLLVPGFRDD